MRVHEEIFYNEYIHDDENFDPEEQLGNTLLADFMEKGGSDGAQREILYEMFEEWDEPEDDGSIFNSDWEPERTSDELEPVHTVYVRNLTDKRVNVMLALPLLVLWCNYRFVAEFEHVEWMDAPVWALFAVYWIFRSIFYTIDYFLFREIYLIHSRRIRFNEFYEDELAISVGGVGAGDMEMSFALGVYAQHRATRNVTALTESADRHKVDLFDSYARTREQVWAKKENIDVPAERFNDIPVEMPAERDAFQAWYRCLCRRPKVMWLAIFPWYEEVYDYEQTIVRVLQKDFIEKYRKQRARFHRGQEWDEWDDDARYARARLMYVEGLEKSNRRKSFISKVRTFFGNKVY